MLGRVHCRREALEGPTSQLPPGPAVLGHLLRQSLEIKRPLSWKASVQDKACAEVLQQKKARLAHDSGFDLGACKGRHPEAPPCGPDLEGHLGFHLDIGLLRYTKSLGAHLGLCQLPQLHHFLPWQMEVASDDAPSPSASD